MKGQTLASKVLAEALIDHAAWRRQEVFEQGHVITLQPGDAVFSLSQLCVLTGATRQQIRDARTALMMVHFCEFWQAHGGGRARTIYRLTQWWRFIQAGTAGELDPAADVPPTMARGGIQSTSTSTQSREHNRKSDGIMAGRQSKASKEPVENTIGTQSGSRVSRPNGQSAEHTSPQAGARVREGAEAAPLSMSAADFADELSAVLGGRNGQTRGAK